MRRAVAAICGLVLGGGVLVAGAAGDGVVPVEGPWHGKSSAGLPIQFEVKEGQIINARFRFKWGFCGTYTTQTPPAPIDPGGHWKAEDSATTYAEGTFVAPDRTEGVVVAPSRMTPGCPRTQATFVAEPGAAPFKEPEAVVLAVVGKHRYVHAPKTIVLKRDGSMRFEGLHWRGWGEEVTKATGRAFIGVGWVIRRPRVTVTLDELVEGGEQKVYLILEYTLHGKVPPGFRHHGERLMEEYARA
ncbi:MAG TPA: hypothetical protein VHZ54_17650 [Solirubrobacterales bacterium]|jgi:hypothetical protein|nr:hypothetical protein [Solirubrobacterales bacterium]